MDKLSELPIDELAEGICLRAGRIAAAEAELLPWIAEFDRREGWAGTGLLSCAHWLSWNVGLSLPTAREQVRVSHRLEELPQVAAAYGAGRISYSKVRAITRVAEPGDGVDWVEHARHASAAQLEKIVRGMRRARANEQAERDPEAAAWSLRTRLRYDDNGSFSLTISGPAQFLPVVQAGIEAEKAELQRQREAAAAEAAEEEAAAGSEPADASAEASESESENASAEAPETVQVQVQDELVGTAPDGDEPDLDGQAAGWPAGTSRADVAAAIEGLFAAQAQLREQGTGPEEPVEQAAPAPAAEASARPAEPADTSAEAPEPTAVTDAQALLALAQDALAAEQAAHPGIARRRRPQLTVQVDPLSGWGRLADGELLPPSSLRSVLKSLPGRGGVLRLRPVTAADLRRHDLGRTAREASIALRELLGALDGERCRFPGCTRHKKLHAHHVVYWSQGGTTDLDNMILVCSRHHTLIHSQNFCLVLHPDRRLELHTADGTDLLHHPAPSWGDPAALARGCGRLVSAETLPADHCDARLDLGYVVSVLIAQAA